MLRSENGIDFLTLYKMVMGSKARLLKEVKNIENPVYLD